MRISDWSSDVCSSDLGLIRKHASRASRGYPRPLSSHWHQFRRSWNSIKKIVASSRRGVTRMACPKRPIWHTWIGEILKTDRKSVVEGRGGTVSVDLGGGDKVDKEKEKKEQGGNRI